MNMQPHLIMSMIAKCLLRKERNLLTEPAGRQLPYHTEKLVLLNVGQNVENYDLNVTILSD